MMTGEQNDEWSKIRSGNNEYSVEIYCLKLEDMFLSLVIVICLSAKFVNHRDDVGNLVKICFQKLTKHTVHYALCTELV